MSWDSYQVDKLWINIKNYGIKFNDELETIWYFTEGWNKNKYSEDKFHDVYYHGLCPSVKDDHFTNEAKVKRIYNSLNECLLQIKYRHKPIFSATENMTNVQIIKVNWKSILHAKKQIRKEIQQLYHYLNCLSSNDIFDAAMRHHFIGHQFQDNLHNQCECPLNKR